MRPHIQYNSPVVLTFALLSLGALALGWATGGWTTLHLFCVYRSPLSDPLTYVRLVGHVLGHSGYAHYLSNMMLLLVVGPPLEEKYGSRASWSRPLSPGWSSFCVFLRQLCLGPAASYSC